MDTFTRAISSYSSQLVSDDVYNISSSTNDKLHTPESMTKPDILLAAILIPFFCILLPAMMCMIFLCSRRRRRPTQISKRSYRPDLSTFFPRSELQQAYENTTELQNVKAMRGSRMHDSEVGWENLIPVPPKVVSSTHSYSQIRDGPELLPTDRVWWKMDLGESCH